MTEKFKGCMLERRFDAQLVQSEDTEQLGILEGMPIVFNEVTTLTDGEGRQIEEVILPTAIQPGAITRDCALFYNHDSMRLPLARVRTGKLQLDQTHEGVKMRAQLNLERHDCSDIWQAIKDGDITGMSFAFRMDGYVMDYTHELPRRVITSIPYISEVSITPTPAYNQTYVTARSRHQVETEADSVETVMQDFTEYKDKVNRERLALAKAKAKARMGI